MKIGTWEDHPSYSAFSHDSVTAQLWDTHCWITLEGVYGAAAKAVRRKLRRMARQLHLTYSHCLSASADICVNIYSRKDITRTLELLKYACGRKLASTANNNNGRWQENI